MKIMQKRGLNMLVLFLGIWILCIMDCLCLRKYRFTVGKVIGVKRNSAHEFIELLALLGVFLLITSNRTGMDITNYVSRYNYSTNLLSGTEIVYNFLRIKAHSFGINFYVFRAIFTLITSIFAIWTLKKLNVSICFFLVFYMPLLLFMDSMQVRNGAAVSILVCAVYYLIKDEKKNRKRNIVIFFVLLLLSVGIHTAYIFYISLLVYLLKNKNNKKMIIGTMSLGILFTSTITLLNNNTIPLVNLIYSVLLSDSDQRRTRYITTGNMGFLYPTVVLILTLILLIRIKQYFSERDTIESRFLEVSILLTQFSLCFIPFVMMNMNYYRFARNTYIFFIIDTGIALKNIEVKNKRKYICVLNLILTGALWWYFDIYIYNTPEIIFDPILKEGIWFFK